MMPVRTAFLALMHNNFQIMWNILPTVALNVLIYQKYTEPAIHFLGWLKQQIFLKKRTSLKHELLNIKRQDR